MLILSRELIFIRREADGSERQVRYPPGTPVAVPPVAAHDEAGMACVQRAKELQARQGQLYRVVHLDGRWRVIRSTDLQLVSDVKQVEMSPQNLHERLPNSPQGEADEPHDSAIDSDVLSANLAEVPVTGVVSDSRRSGPPRHPHHRVMPGVDRTTPGTTQPQLAFV